MAGYYTRVSGRPLMLSVLLLAVLGKWAEGQYVVDYNYCYSDSPDANVTSRIIKFSNLPGAPPYHYAGARYTDSSTFSGYQWCADVTRVQTTLKVINASLVQSAATRQTRTNLLTKMNKVVLPQMKELVSALNLTLISANVTFINITNNAASTNATATNATSTNATATNATSTNATATNSTSTNTTNATSSSVTSNNVTYNGSAYFMVEFVLRGRDASLQDQVAAGVLAALANDTDVDPTGMEYTVVACSKEPPAPPGTTNLTSTGKLAGATATYSCGAGYRLNTLSDTVVSLCDHSTTTWTPIPANLSCIVDMRCVGPPPLPPVNASYTWDKKNLEQFTQINYTCLPSFRATEGTFQTSQCVNKNWTNISSTFQCEYYGCGKMPPQVPDNAVLAWNTFMTQDTVATYRCMDGYIAIGSSSSVKLTCTNKTWGNLPSDFRCINSAYAFRTRVTIDDIDYFLVITIPSLAGLLFFICCCLCCTRTDSPLYCICNPRRKDNGFP